MKTKNLRKLATDIYNKHFDKYFDNPDKNRDFLIDAMLSFHEQASRDMFTTDDMLGFAEHCRLTEVLPTYDNLDIWLAIKDK